MNRRLFLKRYGTVAAGAVALPAISFADLPQDEEVFSWPADPSANWPGYHLVHPDHEADFFPGDPNPAIFYKGNYHLHYLYKAPEGGLAMAHVSSADMLHWKWHPTVLRRKITGCESLLSGTAFLTKEGKPAIIFSDNKNVMIVFALDDDLDKWTMPEKVEVKGTEIGVWDPDCWLDSDTYYAISSTNGVRRINLIRSKDLKNWNYVGDLMHDDFPFNLGVTANDDVSCPNMFKIGNKWMLLCISHTLGCRYYLGDFKDEKSESDILIKNVQNYLLKEMSGDSMEFEIVFKALKGTHKLNPDLNIPRSFGLKVLCDVNGNNGIPIMINPGKKTLSVGDVSAPFEYMIDRETVLRVFIDNSIIEAFVNDRQAIAYAQKRTHPFTNNFLFSDQGNMPVKKISAWKMKSPWN